MNINMKFFAGLVLAVTCITSEAMPTRAELKSVQGMVNELMAEDIVAMKGGKTKASDVARKAEKFAGEATDEASKFLFYKGAFGLYVQGGSYDEAVKALETMQQNVKDVPDKVLAEIVRDKLKRISRKNGEVLFDLYDRLDRRGRFAAEIASLEKKAKASPSDKDIRRQLAIARVQIGAWPEALKDFAALGGKEAAAVANETKNPAAAADFWWNYAAEENLEDAFREHAAALYRQAVDAGSLKGIQLSLAKKRMQEFGGPAAAACPVEQAKADATEEKAKEPVRVTLKANAAKLPKPIVIPLKGKGVRPLTFMPIPAGEGYVGQFGVRNGAFAYTKCEITRPFLMAKLPIDCAQWKAVMGVCHQNEWMYSHLPMSNHTREAYEAFGGAKGVAVENVPTGGECFDFVARLNKDYKRYLPKGMVFRLPTCAEYLYAQAGGRENAWQKSLFSIFAAPQMEEGYDWLAKENPRIADYVTVLKNAGLKLPDIDFSGSQKQQRKDLQHWGDMGIRFHPIGLKDPNPYGICDMRESAELLDRLGSESLPANVQNRYEYLIREFDRSVAETKDPLFWTEDRHCLTMCKAGDFGFVKFRPIDEASAGTIRVVIGPDLVSEWKARQKK